ncbi:hypothetical protein HN51_058553, partial [Arachis hypogaea]
CATHNSPEAPPSKIEVAYCSSPTARRLLLVSRRLRSPSVPLLCSSPLARQSSPSVSLSPSSDLLCSLPPARQSSPPASLSLASDLLCSSPPARQLSSLLVPP